MDRLLNRRLIVALVFVVSSGIVQAQGVPVDDELSNFEILDGEFICAKVRMFDQTSLFIVDTGASLTVLDRRFQPRLGQRTEDSKLLQTPSGGVRLPVYRSPQMVIVGTSSEMDLTVPFVGVADLKSVQALLDYPIAGLVGMDFLKNHVLRVNFDERRAALVRIPRETAAETKQIDFGRSELITPSIRLRISDDQFHQVVVDTGAINHSLDLDANLFQKLKQRARVAVDGETMSTALNGAIANQTGIIDQVELGDIELRNVRVSQTTMNSAGLRFLERFEVEFDFLNRKAYFRPGKRLRGPIRTNLAQFGVKRVDGNTVVIGSRGIAQDAGIRANDSIAKVNDRPSRELTLAEFRHLQSVPDSDLKLQLERDGKAFDVSLHLQQPPNPFPESADESKEVPEN